MGAILDFFLWLFVFLFLLEFVALVLIATGGSFFAIFGGRQ